MANITINATPTRVQYTATGGQTVFTYSFPIKEDSDLKVYQRSSGSSPVDADDLLTITTQYTVTGANTEDGGTVVLVTGATAGDIVTIVGDKPVDRTAIYNQSSTLKKADLNNDFNDNIMYDKQINTVADQLTPQYARSEEIYRDRDNTGNNVRADNLILPILDDGYIWIGRGNKGDTPDDINRVQIGDFDALGLLDADYVIGTANALLPNAQVLGSIGSGFVVNTVVGPTGTLSTTDIDDVGTEIVTVTQPSHGFNVGDWLYRDGGTNLYAKAKADDAVTAEEIGVVKEVIDTNTFKLQQSGYTESLSGLTDGTLYYLSPSTAGAMTSTKPTDPGHYNKPVFIAVDSDKGWILSYRTLMVGSADNPIITVITQTGHGFSFGDFIYRRGNPDNDWAKGQANSAVTAEVQGMVVAVPDANTFVLQMMGYVPAMSAASWAPTVDGQIYFLSPSTAGEATLTEPTTTGHVSKPVFAADGTDSGRILHYRGMEIGGGGSGGTGNGLFLITSLTFSGETDHVFTGFSGWKFLKIILDEVTCSGSADIRMRIAYGAGPTVDTGASYQNAGSKSGSSSFWGLGNLATNSPISAVIESNDISNTTTGHVKKFMGYSASWGVGGVVGTENTTELSMYWFRAGLPTDQEPITGIELSLNSGAFTGGTVYIYGVG